MHRPKFVDQPAFNSVDLFSRVMPPYHLELFPIAQVPQETPSTMSGPLPIGETHQGTKPAAQTLLAYRLTDVENFCMRDPIRFDNTQGVAGVCALEPSRLAFLQELGRAFLGAQNEVHPRFRADSGASSKLKLLHSQGLGETGQRYSVYLLHGEVKLFFPQEILWGLYGMTSSSSPRSSSTSHSTLGVTCW
jgi:hypothetical protein